MIEAYPLYWPDGQTRVPPSRRRSAKFSTGFTRSRDELVEELRRMGARAVIVSTNIPLRRDGLYGRCRVMVPTHIIEGRDYESQMCCNSLPCALHPTALGAPAAAAGEEGTR